MLAQSVEHGTFNLRVAGSSPAQGFCLMVQDVKYRNPFLPPLGLMGDEGPSRESLCGPVCCLLAPGSVRKSGRNLGNLLVEQSALVVAGTPSAVGVC